MKRNAIPATVSQDLTGADLVAYIMVGMAGDPMSDLRSINNPLSQIRIISIVYGSPVTNLSGPADDGRRFPRVVTVDGYAVKSMSFTRASR